jgi:hypothetical protein
LAPGKQNILLGNWKNQYQGQRRWLEIWSYNQGSINN